MFGVFFFSHPDLRRILSDYGFEGHPLRKDFPLTGFLEVSYNELKKQIIYEKILISQEQRSFDFEMPVSLVDTKSKASIPFVSSGRIVDP